MRSARTSYLCGLCLLLGMTLGCRDEPRNNLGAGGGPTAFTVVASSSDGFIEQPPVPLPRFELARASGRTLGTGDLVGRWSVLFFGFTSCPDVCPETLGRLKQAYATLDDRASFQALFVSVDPGRDTAERLRGYVEHYGPSFLGATGDIPTLDLLTQAVGASYELPEGREGAYQVGHSSALFVIDPEARRVGTFTSSATASGIAQRLQQLQRQFTPRVVVHDPWIRQAPPGAPARAGYLTLGNATPKPMTLVGAASDAFERVELHQTSIDSGMARMQAVEKLPLSAGARIQLSPGGYHLMLIGPKRNFESGETILLELQFETGPPLAVSAQVREG